MNTPPAHKTIWTRSYLARLLAATVIAALLLAACGSDDTSEGASNETVASTTTEASATDTSVAADPADGETVTFTAEVWADNWFALYANGELVGEDSVPITTERSFNAETVTFEASFPLTLAIEAKDFKETDSGLEYIGEPNEQLGDGGIIAQITDESTGEIISVTDDTWTALVVHRAPLNDCVGSADPATACDTEITDTPSEWTEADFDDTDWSTATVWTVADVDPKDGYDQVTWDPTAQLIWGTDLEVDNTVLLRQTITG
jgi:major membrane immunogen (membrane-anchored lipoprotein)